jgi:thiamine kinase-like enzyme
MSTTARDRVAQLDFWSSQVEPEPLGGGITNTNFFVDDQGQKYVVRIGEDIPVHGMMRFNEIAAARAAFEADISPEIVYTEQGLFIIRFVEGYTFKEQDVRKQQNLEKIVPLIRACHTKIPKYFRGPALIFWPFHACRNYILTATETNERVTHLLPRFLEINAELERSIGEIQLVFGHNDLVAANFIDDGKRLWLIDWDYAGYNAGLFDLANLCSNNELSPEQEDWLLEAYYQKPTSDIQRRRLAALKCVSLLRETLWSIVSETHSTLDFNYVNYSEKNIDRFKNAYLKFRQM